MIASHTSPDPPGDSEPEPPARSPRHARLVALRVAQVGLYFVATVIVARKLGPAGRAQYALPLAAAGVAGALAHLSLGTAAVRLLSRREAKLEQLTEQLSAAMLVLSVIAMLGTVGYCVAARGAIADAATSTILLSAATVPCALVAQVAGLLLIAIGDVAAWALATVFGALVQLGVLAAYLSAATLDPTSAMAIALAGFFVTAVAMVITLSGRVGLRALRPRWSRQLGGRLVTIAFGLHPGTLALQLGSRIDLLIVGALASVRSAGLYSLALTLGSSAYLVTQTLTLGAMHTQMQDEVGAAVRFTAMYTRQALALSFTICGFVAAVGYPFITFVYGVGWRGAVVPFVILLFAAVAMAVEEPVRQILFRVGRPAVTSAAACGSVLINAAATVALFGPLGITGASLGSVLAFWIYAGVMVILLVRASDLRVSELIGLPRRTDPIIQLIGGFAARVGIRSAPPPSV